MLIQHHSAEEYRRRAVDQFDQLLSDARADGSARVMALVVHPYIMGAPHRLKYLDQALEHINGHSEAQFYTGEQILDWYLAARPGAAGNPAA
jgi:allantoinase